MEIVNIPDRTIPQDFLDSEWDKIKQFFPYKELRPNQREAIVMINFALNNGFKNIIFEAPVGSGKSVNSMVVCFQRGSFYAITPSIGLQKQYISEFGSSYLKEVKGRGNFACLSVDGINCDDAPCTNDKKYECENADRCLYKTQRREAMSWQMGVVSNPQYLFRVIQHFKPNYESKCMLPEFENKCSHDYPCENGIDCVKKQSCEYPLEKVEKPTFARRKICIIDEAHNMENIFFDFLQRTINPRDYYILNLKMPDLPENASEWVQQIEMLYDKCVNCVEDEKDKDKKLKLKKLQSKLFFIQNLLNDIDNVTVVREKHSNNARDYSVKFQPKKVNKFAPWFWDRLAHQRIFVSATLRPFEKFCEDLGLNKDETFVVSINESPFPVENRQINVLKVGQMSHSRQEKTLPKQLTILKQILETHANERGIILPFTHNIRKITADFLSKKFPGRILTHDSKNMKIPCPSCHLLTHSTEEIITCPNCGEQFHSRERDYIIQKFLEETNNNFVLVSTYVGEGFDLGGDKNIKFLIIQKVPYPDMGAREVRERVLLEQKEYRQSINNNCEYTGSTGEELCENWGCRACGTWYSAQAVKKIQQFCGRIVRSKNDVGAIYILDTSFTSLYKNCGDMFAEYFRDAVNIHDLKNIKIDEDLKEDD